MTTQADDPPGILVFSPGSLSDAVLTAYLGEQGFAVYNAATPDELDDVLSTRDIHVTLVDIDDSRPVSLLRALSPCLRARAPILVTGLRDTPTDRIAALDMGADRYLARPFSERELMAHIRALTRPVRLNGVQALLGDLSFKGWRLQPARHKLFTPAGDDVPLTHREFLILKAFAENSGVLLSRPVLMQKAEIDDTGTTARLVDLAIYRLRAKLKSGLHGDTLITTRHGLGYLFTAAVSRN